MEREMNELCKTQIGPVQIAYLGLRLGRRRFDWVMHRNVLFNQAGKNIHLKLVIIMSTNPLGNFVTIRQEVIEPQNELSFTHE